MIVLFSYEGDKSTNHLIDWLEYYNCKYIRINLLNEDFRNIKLFMSNDSLTIELHLLSGEMINIAQCDYFYVRGVGFNKPKLENTTNLPDKIFHHYIDEEFNALTKFFYSEVNKKSVGCFYTDSHRKLQQLSYAKQTGLSICNTLITNSRNDITNYYGITKTITKAIEDNIGTEHNNKLIVQRVQRIDNNNVEDSFFPSLFQNEIDKEYELRVFYLEGKCYSIRFNSSSDNIDMRDNYDVSDYEPYKLPNFIEEQIIKFMNKMQLISGSLVLTPIMQTNFKFFFK